MTLAELHSAAPDGQRAIDPEFKEYEIKKVREYLKPEAFKVFEQRGWLSQKEAAKLQAVIEDRIQKYSGITSIPGAFTHRDAHPGNIIKDFSDQSMHLIDNETLMWSVRKENGKVYGVGDPLADIGRFVAGLTLQAKRGKMSDADIAEVTNEFIENYEAKMSFDRMDFKASLDFYFIRFAAVVLNQEHSNSANTPDMQRQMLDLLKQKFL
jgi:hypothetical protein